MEDRRPRGSKDGGRPRTQKRDAASSRIETLLSEIEKALTRRDFQLMLEPLTGVIAAVRAMRAPSIAAVEAGARGKLITTLSRVMREARPPENLADNAAAPPVAEVPVEPAEVAQAGDAQDSSPPSETVPPVSADGSGSKLSDEAPIAVDAGTAAVTPPKAVPWEEAMLKVGIVWATLGESDRATSSFERAGRTPDPMELVVPPRAEEASAPDRTSPRVPRGRREHAASRTPRERRWTATHGRSPVSAGWEAEAQLLRERGRTRDAARLYETNHAWAEAVALFEEGGAPEAALRAAAKGGLQAKCLELAAKMPPERVEAAFEAAQAWDQLMDLHVARSNFEGIAKLYERAKQYGEAGLAWERAQKFAHARKAFERANDLVSANRMREEELKYLVAHGDRLGAARLLMTVGRKAEALASLEGLPAAKAMHFMQVLKLSSEANAFARARLAASAGSPLEEAQWHEVLGEKREAIAKYILAERKGKAASLYAEVGDFAKAGEFAEADRQFAQAATYYRQAGDAASERRAQAAQPVAAPSSEAVHLPEGDPSPA